VVLLPSVLARFWIAASATALAHCRRSAVYRGLGLCWIERHATTAFAHEGFESRGQSPGNRRVESRFIFIQAGFYPDDGSPVSIAPLPLDTHLEF
jgi:hypothetical protein